MLCKLLAVSSELKKSGLELGQQGIKTDYRQKRTDSLLLPYCSICSLVAVLKVIHFGSK
jgi:hypothetical protein